MSKEQLEVLEISALLHDVGKIGIPDHILNKPTSLTEEEFNRIKEHPSLGIDILKSIEFLNQALPIIPHHHERIDGGGYPYGIKVDTIPFESKIISVADSYDAMTSNRPYRKGLSHEVAINELVRYRNLQFDATVVDAFLRIDVSSILESD